MNIKNKLLAVTGITAVLLLTAGPAFALGDRLVEKNRNRQRVAAPEIDVGSGTKALAVLAVGLLLAGERLRRR
jgi:hypothetical protein